MPDRRIAFRRCATFLSGLLVAIATGWTTAGAAELRVLNWKGWGTDEPWAIAEFEARTGHKIVHDYITSFPEMFTKMRTNPGYYDVVNPSAVFAMQAVEEGLVQPIDVSRLDNYQDVIPDMRNSPHFTSDGQVWAVPWEWVGTSISYNTDAFDAPPESVQILWDPAYANRVCWRDNAGDSVRFAALATGQDPQSPTDMDAIRDKLRALKPQI